MTNYHIAYDQSQYLKRQKNVIERYLILQSGKCKLILDLGIGINYYNK